MNNNTVYTKKSLKSHLSSIYNLVSKKNYPKGEKLPKKRKHLKIRINYPIPRENAQQIS